MTNLMDAITDDADRQYATDLAEQPGWNSDLAAVAVLCGNAGAVEVINNALKQAVGASADEKAKAEIALLQQKIAEAKQLGDVKRLVSLKTHLYDRYKVGSM